MRKTPASVVVLMITLIAGVTGWLSKASGAVEVPEDPEALLVYGEDGFLLRQSGSATSAQPALLSFPIDRTVQTVQVHVRHAPSSAVTLLGPSGKRIVNGMKGVRITQRPAEDIYIVWQPDPGNWELRIEGTGDFSVTAIVTSPVRIFDFNFVRLRESSHGGYSYFPIEGQPVIGLGEPEASGEAALVGEIASAHFALESERGEVLAPLSLKQNAPGSRDNYYGLVPLPSVPFRVVVSGNVAVGKGQDTRGIAYRRVFPTLYRARTLGIEVVGNKRVRAAPGQRLSLEYCVRNRGPAGKFEFAARDELGFVKGVTPESVEIPQDGTAIVRVNIALSPSAEEDDLDEVMLAAKQVDSSEIANTATASIWVWIPDPVEPDDR
jgi:hypothetical protein